MHRTLTSLLLCVFLWVSSALAIDLRPTVSPWLEDGTNTFLRVQRNVCVGIGPTATDALSLCTSPVASATRALLNVSNTPLVAGAGGGTYIGANPAAFTGNFFDMQIAGVSKASLSNAGNLILATPVAMLSGGTGLSTAADDTTLVSTGTAWEAKTLPNCTDSAGNHLNYTQATNAFSCGTSINPTGSITLTNAHLFVGSAGNVATDVAVSGDLSLVASGAFTIASLAVTNAKIANSTIDLTTKVMGILPNANTTATSANTASAIMARDGSGGNILSTLIAQKGSSSAPAASASADNLVAENNGNAGISILTPDANSGYVVWGSPTGGNGYAYIQGDYNGGTTQLRFTTTAGGAAVRMTLQSGLQMGAPTGADKGSGTINTAGDIYKNGTAYTNPQWVLKQYYTGTADTEGLYAMPVEYQGLTSLEATEAFVRQFYELPMMLLRRDEGIFARGDLLLAAVEELYLHMFELKNRIKALEVN